MVRPVDSEAAVVAYLDGQLAVPVSTRVPADRPESFVRAYKVGGARVNCAQERVLLFVEAWAASEVEAGSLAGDVWSLLDASDGEVLDGGAWLADSSDGLATPVRNDDPESGSPRYTFTANLTIGLSLETA